MPTRSSVIIPEQKKTIDASLSRSSRTMLRAQRLRVQAITVNPSELASDACCNITDRGADQLRQYLIVQKYLCY
jgi:hypothetical protein